MILVIPQILLSDGNCPVPIEGMPSGIGFYKALADAPEKLCQFIRNENARSIFIVDEDALKLRNNTLNTQKIKNSVKSTEIPIIVYSAFETIETCRELLDEGVYRIVIDEPSVFDPKDLRELIIEYTPSRIAFLFELRDNYMFSSENNLKSEVSEYSNYLKSFGASRIILSCPIWREESIDLKNCRWIADIIDLKISLWGEIQNSNILLSLHEYESSGIDSIILGKSLFENRFPCQQIWRMIEPDSDKFLLLDKK